MPQKFIALAVCSMCIALTAPPAEAGRLSCDAVRGVKSRASRDSVTIKFTNKTTEQRTAMWIDFSGAPVQYFTLAAGQSVDQQTFLGHYWFFTDGPGNCIEAMLPTPGKNRYSIKVPSPGFGRE
jgi:hypothetical protein